MLPLVPAPPALSPEPCKLKPKNFQTLTDEQIPSILDCRSTDVAHKPPVSTFNGILLKQSQQKPIHVQKQAEETKCFPNQCLFSYCAPMVKSQGTPPTRS
jgi:hypothetical protein